MLKKMAASVLVLGGCTEPRENGALKSIEKLRFTESPFSMENEKISYTLNTARRSPSVMVHNQKILISGGCEKEHSHLSSLEVINLDDWTVTEMPSSLTEHSCAAFCKVQDSLLEVGGFDGPDCLKTVTFVNCDGETTKLSDFCSRLKNSAVIYDVDFNVYVFGGWDESRTMTAVFRLSFSPELTVYNSSMVGLLPYPIEGHTAVKHGDFVYIIGGYDGINVVDTIVRYSLKTRRSEIIPVKLEHARENHTSQLIFDRYLLVIGGWDGQSAMDNIEIFEFIDEKPFLKKVEGDFRLDEKRIRPASVLIP